MRHNVEDFLRRIRLRWGFKFRPLGRLFLRLRGGSAQHGAHDLETELLEYLPTAPGYYIELGANDGVIGSNTLCLEIFRGWRGALIEPASLTFGKLQKNRSSRRNTLVRAACVSNSYESDTVELAFAGLMSTAIGLESDVDDPLAHAESGLAYSRHLDGSLQTEFVPATTLTEVLLSGGAPNQISLLSLDVEGAELEVLKGLDFELFRIDWILVECRNFPRMSRFLRSEGYELEAQLSDLDYLFKFEPRGKGV